MEGPSLLRQALRPQACRRTLQLVPAGQASRPHRYLHTSRPLFANEQPASVPVSLIAALRKQRPVPLSLAREALQKSSNDLAKALAYLESTSQSTSAKAEKLSARPTSQGTIAVSLLGTKRASIIHLACETDFVAATPTFQTLASGIAGTAAFLDVPGSAEAEKDPERIEDFPVEALLSAPLISIPKEGAGQSEVTPLSDPQTVKSRLLASLGETGENLRLIRAASYASPFPSSAEIRYVPSAYSHQGKVGGLVVLSAVSADPEKPIASLVHGPGGDKLEEGLNQLARGVARQVVGFPTTRITRGDVEGEDGEILLEQDGMMLSSAAGGLQGTVADILTAWGNERGVKVQVVGMRRWSIGDEIEPEAVPNLPTA